MPTISNTVARHYRHVVGVDTHARSHTYAVIACPSGELLDQRSFPTTAAGRSRAITWIADRTGNLDGDDLNGGDLNGGDLDSVLVAVEGTGSYGATISADLAATGLRVVEAPTPSRSAGRSKTDTIDAVAAARSTMATDTTNLRDRRGGGGGQVGEVRAALAVLDTARQQLNTARLGAINALTALVRTHDLGIDARRALTPAQVHQIARWRTRNEPLSTATARTEAVRLATQVTTLDTDLRTNRARIANLVEDNAPHLTTRLGVGPVTAASVLVAWSHPGRIRSEAAFAMIAGTAPLEASSGNTTRHRLNRGGDRRLNKAIHTITLTRTSHDPATKAYIARRRAEGKTDREIRRCLKRYITRQLYRDLNNPDRTTTRTTP